MFYKVNIFINTLIPSHLVIFQGGQSEGFQNVRGRACGRFGRPGGVPEGLPVAQLEIRGEPQLGRHERLAVDQPDHLASNPTSRQLQQPCRLLSTWLRFFWGTVQRGKEIGIIHHTSVNSCYLLHNCLEQWQLYILIWRHLQNLLRQNLIRTKNYAEELEKQGGKYWVIAKQTKRENVKEKRRLTWQKSSWQLTLSPISSGGEQTSSKDV